MKNALKAYMDLMRLHFFFVWPVLFCSGLFLAFQYYGEFSLVLVGKAVLIGFLGFEAGLVLNDIVDAEIDKKDVEFDKLTKYWRVFGKRPISQGLISRRSALMLFAVLVGATVILVLTLPFPQSGYLLTLMAICYCLEIFYQIKKRNETLPIAQLVGRIDFTLFPVAGYLCIGHPNINALLLALFFYPLAMAHLGVNDIIDVANDQARGMKTIPTLFGMQRTAYWILAFTAIHFVTATVFMSRLGAAGIVGLIISLSLLTIGNFIILKKKTAEAGLKALPMFHLSMLVYAVSIISSYWI